MGDRAVLHPTINHALRHVAESLPASNAISQRLAYMKERSPGFGSVADMPRAESEAQETSACRASIDYSLWQMLRSRAMRKASKKPFPAFELTADDSLANDNVDDGCLFHDISHEDEEHMYSGGSFSNADADELLFDGPSTAEQATAAQGSMDVEDWLV